MSQSGFVKLRVYQLSELLADEIWNVVNGWPFFEKDTVGKQLVRSADSIGANIAEGHGRGTHIDNKRHVLISRGSLYETKHFLRRAYHRKLLSNEKTGSIKRIINEPSPKLNAYINSLKQKIESSKNKSNDK